MLMRIKSSLERALGPAQTLTVIQAMANHAKELGMRIVVEGLQNQNEEFTLWQLGLNQG